MQSFNSVQDNLSNPIIQLPVGTSNSNGNNVELSVRPWRRSDAASLSHHGDNINVWRKLRNRFPHPYTLAEAESWVTFCTKGKGTAALPVTEFAICVDDVAVGGIGLAMGSDIYIRTAELGYWISEEFWGRGVMSAVAEAFVRWVWTCKDHVQLVRLNAEVTEGNVGSVKVLRKAGFELEGRRPAMSWKTGELKAVLLYGVLRPEGK